MRLPVRARDLPGRIATGGYILHSGLEKWHGDETRAKALHGVASKAFPVLEQIPPERFLRILAASEIAIGTALLVPVVPNVVAGAALTGFSGSLLAMYARTPAMRKPGSIWPSRAGMAVSKDVWMLGIGLGLVIDALTSGGRTGPGDPAGGPRPGAIRALNLYRLTGPSSRGHRRVLGLV